MSTLSISRLLFADAVQQFYNFNCDGCSAQIADICSESDPRDVRQRLSSVEYANLKVRRLTPQQRHPALQHCVFSCFQRPYIRSLVASASTLTHSCTHRAWLHQVIYKLHCRNCRLLRLARTPTTVICQLINQSINIDHDHNIIL